MKYLPGLSALNLNTTYPLLGTAIVSLAGGKLKCLSNNPLLSKSKACFKLIFFTLLSGERPIPITWKEYPCKWNGWLKFGDWTKNKIELKNHMIYYGGDILWTYLRLLIQLLRPRASVYLLCGRTYNSFRSLVVCYHRCRTFPVECRRFVITWGTEERCMRFHPLNW